jgi:hypothetical protein
VFLFVAVVLFYGAIDRTQGLAHSSLHKF